MVSNSKKVPGCKKVWHPVCAIRHKAVMCFLRVCHRCQSRQGEYSPTPPPTLHPTTHPPPPISNGEIAWPSAMGTRLSHLPYQCSFTHWHRDNLSIPILLTHTRTYTYILPGSGMRWQGQCELLLVWCAGNGRQIDNVQSGIISKPAYLIRKDSADLLRSLSLSFFLSNTHTHNKPKIHHE